MRMSGVGRRQEWGRRRQQVGKDHLGGQIVEAEETKYKGPLIQSNTRKLGRSAEVEVNKWEALMIVRPGYWTSEICIIGLLKTWNHGRESIRKQHSAGRLGTRQKNNDYGGSVM